MSPGKDSNCISCRQECKDCKKVPEAEPSVQCSKCLRWQHFKCANVTDDITKYLFNCEECDPTGAVRKNYDDYVAQTTRKSTVEGASELLKAQQQLLLKFGRLKKSYPQLSDPSHEIRADYSEKLSEIYNEFEANDTNLRQTNLEQTHEYYLNYDDVNQQFTDIIQVLEKPSFKQNKNDHPKNETPSQKMNDSNTFTTSEKGNVKHEEPQVSSRDFQDFMKILINKESKGINLNKINIPVFDSKPENWRSFREIVQIMMDDSSINSTRKLLALKQATQGEAKKLIQNIRYGPDADRRAFSLLIGRFDNPRQMINIELTSLDIQQRKIIRFNKTC